MFLEHYGVMVGMGLLLIVSAGALLLARKAARQVARFREDRHERFKGGQPR